MTASGRASVGPAVEDIGGPFERTCPRRGPADGSGCAARFGAGCASVAVAPRYQGLRAAARWRSPGRPPHAHPLGMALQREEKTGAPPCKPWLGILGPLQTNARGK